MPEFHSFLQLSNIPLCVCIYACIRNGILHIHTMEYYSTVKMNTFELVLMRWMNLCIIHSEVSQKEEDKYCILIHIYRI